MPRPAGRLGAPELSVRRRLERMVMLIGDQPGEKSVHDAARQEVAAHGLGAHKSEAAAIAYLCREFRASDRATALALPCSVGTTSSSSRSGWRRGGGPGGARRSRRIFPFKS
jgi:hypothetical protein